MKLPIDFLENLKVLLNDEYDDFLNSYENERQLGLRANTNKISVEEFLKISPFNLTKIPWSIDGFYYENGVRPAKHPFYHAGLYYIQEPSAMTPVEYLDIKEGHKVLDLCAAPGGKSIQIASKIKESGLLVTNDINSNRVKALVKNIELYGVKNAIVTNDTPDRLANNFEGFFDRILVDAPCSGEGMFRKDEGLIKSYEKDDISIYPNMQREILLSASKMLKVGGKLIYSTCTFNTNENENIIKEFLDKNPNFKIVNIPKNHGISSGIEFEEVARLWPHKLNGEGHFLALIEKIDGEDVNYISDIDFGENGKEYEEFERDNLNVEMKNIRRISDNIYSIPSNMIKVTNLKVVRSGLLLGRMNRGRFEPSQALAMALKKEDFKQSINMKSDSVDVIKYLKGETIFIDGQKGFNVVCVDGYPLGFAKLNNGTLKNGYEKSWRYME